MQHLPLLSSGVAIVCFAFLYIFFLSVSDTATVSAASCCFPSLGATGVTLLYGHKLGLCCVPPLASFEKIKQKLREKHGEGWGRGS